MANDCIPFKSPGEDVTAVAEGTVTGKLCVQVSGPRTSGPGLAATAEGSVYTCGIPSTTGAAGAGKRIFGVAGYDAASGRLFKVLRGNKILPITAGGTITAGEEVEVAATGKVIALASGIAIGVAMNSCTVDTDCEVSLY
jgi:hypothetical protein